MRASQLLTLSPLWRVCIEKGNHLKPLSLPYAVRLMAVDEQPREDNDKEDDRSRHHPDLGPELHPETRRITNAPTAMRRVTLI